MTMMDTRRVQPRDLAGDDAYRLYLISRNDPPIVYHSPGMQWRRLRVLARRVRAVFAAMHVANVADRMRRKQVSRGMRGHRAG